VNSRFSPHGYARPLKFRLTDAEVARVQKWASPTTSQRAFSAFVRGLQAAYRGGGYGQDAPEKAPHPAAKGQVEADEGAQPLVLQPDREVDAVGQR
jgi:hypothetical protein